MSSGAGPEPVRIDGPLVDVLAFNPDGSRLATGSPGSSTSSGEIQLWDTTTGRDLATWSIANGVPQDLAFDHEGRQLRVANFNSGRREVSVTRFDASPLAPEIEAVDLVNRLGPDVASECRACREDRVGARPRPRRSRGGARPWPESVLSRFLISGPKPRDGWSSPRGNARPS